MLWLSATPLWQVVSDFTSEVDVAALEAGGEAAKAQSNRRRERQEAWLARDGSADAALWRAEKRPRTAAYQFIRYLDNQVGDP